MANCNFPSPPSPSFNLLLFLGNILMIKDLFFSAKVSVGKSASSSSISSFSSSSFSSSPPPSPPPPPPPPQPPPPYVCVAKPPPPLLKVRLWDWGWGWKWIPFQTRRRRHQKEDFFARMPHRFPGIEIKKVKLACLLECSASLFLKSCASKDFFIAICSRK